MKRSRSKRLFLLAAPMMMFLSSHAYAENASPQSEKPAAHQTDNQAYIYIFDDDPLNALGQSAAGLRLRVRRLGTRTLLIRARGQFINELLQSAERL